MTHDEDASRIGRLVCVISGLFEGKRGAVVFSRGALLRVRVSPPTDADEQRTIQVLIDEVQFID